jgi:hypothetical protein
MNKITRDDTEHGVEYVRADEAEAEIESIQDGADADKVIIQYHEATIKRLQAEIDMLKGALKEWSDKTEWVQETAQPLELGMHRADVLKQRIENLNKAAQHPVIAGALFDFMGWLTSRKKTLILSSADNASPAVEAITEFAKMRGLSLDGARVQDWQDLTLPTPQPVPVKTYHDGKPWPVAPKPWVGLSEDEINKLRHLVDWTAEWSYGRFAYELERLLREKNHG